MIRLQFVACGDAASAAIKIFSRGWCSHVDCVLTDGTLLGARIDGGVQIRPPDYESFDLVERVCLDVAPAAEARYYDFLRRQIGKPYDKLAIVAFAAERNWRTPDAWFCSELAAAALEDSGWFPKPVAASVSEITPRDLLILTSPWDASS